MGFTLGDVKEECRARLGEPAEDFYLDSELTRWANRGQYEYARRTKGMRSRWVRSVSTNASYVPAPNDLIRIEKAWFLDGAGQYYPLKVGTWGNLPVMPNSTNAAGSMPSRIYLRRDNLLVLDVSLSARVTNGLVVEGVQKPVAVINDTAELFRPESPTDDASPYIGESGFEAVCDYVVAHAKRKDEDYDAARDSDGMFNQKVALGYEQHNDPIEQNYQMNSFLGGASGIVGLQTEDNQLTTADWPF